MEFCNLKSDVSLEVKLKVSELEKTCAALENEKTAVPIMEEVYNHRAKELLALQLSKNFSTEISEKEVGEGYPLIRNTTAILAFDPELRAVFGDPLSKLDSIIKSAAQERKESSHILLSALLRVVTAEKDKYRTAHYSAQHDHLLRRLETFAKKKEEMKKTLVKQFARFVKLVFENTQFTKSVEDLKQTAGEKVPPFSSFLIQAGIHVTDFVRDLFKRTRVWLIAQLEVMLKVLLPFNKPH